MYSFFLLLSIWLFLVGLLGQRLSPKANTNHLLPLTFVLACMVQINVNYLLLANIRSPRSIAHLLLSLAAILLAVPLLLPTSRRQLRSLFCGFLFPAPQRLTTGHESLQGFLVKSRALIVVSSVALIFLTRLLTPTVFNWDSNWYNLSRIPAMMIEHSMFPENTPVLWHLLHPISHDLLYLPDIAANNLRGMGLICTLEYLVILGCLYQISLSLLADFETQGKGIKTQLVLLLVTMLFLSSDLQVLQSADPKNDLAILMTFIISLSIGLNASLRRAAPFQYLLFILFLLIYSISSKAYGVIVLMPPLVVLVLRVFSSLRGLHLVGGQWRAFCGNLIRDGKDLFCQNRLIVLFVSFNAAFMVFTYVYHVHSVFHSVHSAALADMASKYSNLQGSFAEKGINFALNALRNSVSFLLYPYTTLRKLNAVKPDDYLLGFGPLTSFLYDPRGMENGPSIVRDIKADAAHGSILMAPLLMVVSGLLLRQLWLSPVRLNKQLQMVSTQSIQFCEDALVITLSCLFTFLFLSYALLNHTFVSKYMGSTYVPLMPLLAVLCMELVRFRLKHLLLPILFVSLYGILRFAVLINVSLIPTFLNQVVASPSTLRVQQSSNLFYYQYAAFRFSVEEASHWLSHLSRLPSDQTHIFCFGKDTPNLVPLMYGIQSFDHSKNIKLALSSSSQCKSELQRFKDHQIDKGRSKENGMESFRLKNSSSGRSQVNYIYLP